MAKNKQKQKSQQTRKRQKLSQPDKRHLIYKNPTANTIFSSLVFIVTIDIFEFVPLCVPLFLGFSLVSFAISWYYTVMSSN